MQPARPLVLVVDDDPTICDLVRELLESEGYRVECAPDGASGLARLATGEVGLVLIDARLPGMSGAELCQRIRREASGARLPVILFTAMAGDVEGYAAAAGADEALPKPFDLDDLLACVRRWLPALGPAAG
jgi:CheY-like chemotaxis protein